MDRLKVSVLENLKWATNRYLTEQMDFFYKREDVNFTSGCCKLVLFGERQNGFVEPQGV